MFKSKFSLLVIVLGMFFGIVSHSALANTDSWQKGVTIMPGSVDEYASSEFHASIDQAEAAHVDSVALVVPLYQDGLYANEIHSGWNTPTDEALRSGIEYIHSKHMKVMVKIHLYPGNDAWIARIHPSDTGAWFASYAKEVDHYATIGGEEHIELYCFGAEIISLSTDPRYLKDWQQVIATIHEKYSGPITYSANWGPGIYDEKNKLTFWKDVDFIGLSAYFPIKQSTDWAYWNKTQISKLQRKYDKPILFSEIGYRSIVGSSAMPWDYTSKNVADEGEQASAYKKLFAYWETQNNFAGIYIWSWQGTSAIDASGKDYTPQGKKALTIISKEFAPSIQEVITPQALVPQMIIPVTSASISKRMTWYTRVSSIFSIFQTLSDQLLARLTLNFT